MHAHRFHTDLPLVPGASVALDPGEVRHVSQVLRLREGDPVTLFDGQGGEAEARLGAAGRRELNAVVESVREVEPPRPAIELLVPWMKQGARLDWLLEKAAELGTSCVRIYRAPAGRGEERAARWRRLTIAAAKQSGSAWLMRVEARGDVEPWGLTEARVKVLLTEKPRARLLKQSLPALLAEVAIAVGPEEGFSVDEEAIALTRDWRWASLGPLRLRVETAALAAVAGVLVLAGH